MLLSLCGLIKSRLLGILPCGNGSWRLRRKLGDDPGNPGYIFAEPTVGYCMEQGDGPEPEAESSG